MSALEECDQRYTKCFDEIGLDKVKLKRTTLIGSFEISMVLWLSLNHSNIEGAFNQASKCMRSHTMDNL